MFRVLDAVPAFARPTRAALYAGAALASVLLAAAAPPVMAQTAGDDRITNTDTLVVGEQAHRDRVGAEVGQDAQVLTHVALEGEDADGR